MKKHRDKERSSGTPSNRPKRRSRTLPFAELAQFEIDRESVQLLGHEYCRRHYIVILDRVSPGGEDRVKLGMLHPEREHLHREVARFLGRPVEPVHLNRDEIEEALEPAQLR